MKVLILGGAGFVGTNLAISLHGEEEFGSNENWEVTVVDNLVRRGSENNLPEFKSRGIKFIHGDIRNAEDFNKFGNDYDNILLCAAQPSAINYSNPTFDIQNNTVGVLNTLEYVRRIEAGLIFWSTNKCYSGRVCNRERIRETNFRYEWSDSTFLFDETTDVNGPDHSIYGVSKIMADLMIQEWADAYGIPAIINRFSCLSGPRQWGLAEQGWVTWFAIANELGLPIEIFGFKGKQVRDCLFIDDLSYLIKLQLTNIKKYTGEVFNVGGGVRNTLSLLEGIKILEKNKPFTKITYHEEPRRADQIIYISDTSKVQSHFDWAPTIGIEEGYEQILGWVKNNKKTLEGMYL